MIGTEERAGTAGPPPLPLALALTPGLRELAQARWPETGQDTLPQIAGFIVSSFNPLVAEVAARCLRRRPGPPPQAPNARTALVLASSGWDRATARAITEATASGRRVPPLLFFQSNPNAVLGHIAARWRLAGPVVCLSPPAQDSDTIPSAALTEADWLLRDGDADEVLLIAAEQGAEPDARTGAPRPGDRAAAVLLGRRA